MKVSSMGTEDRDARTESTEFRDVENLPAPGILGAEITDLKAP